MLNYVWIFLMVTSLVFGAVNGKLKEVTTAAFESAGIGLMYISSGLMAPSAYPTPTQIHPNDLSPEPRRDLPIHHSE